MIFLSITVAHTYRVTTRPDARCRVPIPLREIFGKLVLEQFCDLYLLVNIRNINCLVPMGQGISCLIWDKVYLCELSQVIYKQTLIDVHISYKHKLPN